MRKQLTLTRAQWTELRGASDRKASAVEARNRDAVKRRLPGGASLLGPDTVAVLHLAEEALAQPGDPVTVDAPLATLDTLANPYGWSAAVRTAAREARERA